MRQLRITTHPAKNFMPETELPADFDFVKNVARMHANTQAEFTRMCRIGLKAAQDFKAVANERHYHSFGVWVVRHHILQEKYRK